MGWVLKILITAAFHWVYSVYYSDKSTGDTWKFYSDARKLYSCAENKENGLAKILLGMDGQGSPVEECFQSASYWYNSEEISLVNDTRSIIRMNLLLLPFSKGNYLFHLVFFSFLAFLGMCGIYHLLQSKFSNNPVAVNWIVAFGIPSISFWTGGILKESIMLPLFVLFLIFLFNDKPIQKKLLPLILISGLLTQIKFYIGVTALLAIIGMLFFQSIKGLSKRNQIIVSLSCICLSLFLLEIFVPARIPEMMAKKQKDFVNLSRGGDYWTIPSGDTIYVPQPDKAYFTQNGQEFLHHNITYHYWKNFNIKDTLKGDEILLGRCLAKLKPSGSAFSIAPIQPSWTGLILALPQAFVNATFRPFPGELKNPFSLLSFLENYFLLGLVTLIGIKRIKNKHINYSPDFIHTFLIIFCLILLGLIGMTTPVTGALVRYRLPVIWLMAIFCAMHWNRIEEILSYFFGKKSESNSEKKIE